ncbi:hypothetical protein [Roseomonas sp. WA12]
MDLTTLRPADTSSAAIMEALARSQAMQDTAQTQVTSAKAARDGLLLDGDAQQLSVAEKALTEARGDCERVEAIVTELGHRLVASQRAEVFGKLSDALDRTRTAKAARLAWWRKNGPKMQAMLREVSTLHEQAERGTGEVRETQRLALSRYEDAEAEMSAIFAGKEDIEGDSDAWRFGDMLADWCAGRGLNEQVR